jgi:hypothetical protein
MANEVTRLAAIYVASALEIALFEGSDPKRHSDQPAALVEVNKEDYTLIQEFGRLEPAERVRLVAAIMRGRGG